MATELERFRQEKFDQWWNIELKPKMKGLLNELKEKLEKHKEGFLQYYINHDAFDDFLLERVPVTELKKQFEDWFDNNGKPFLVSILESYTKISKYI